MRPSRKHAQILITSIVLVGTLMWMFVLAYSNFEVNRLVMAALWFVTAFAGAQIARRLIVGLTTGDLAISSVLACAGAIGAVMGRGVEPRAEMLLALGCAEAGALLGAATSRRAAAATLSASSVRAIWRVLGAGFAGYGAMLLAGGAALLVTSGDHFVLTAIAGTLAASAIVVRFTPTEPAQCALGVGLVMATMVATSHEERLSVLVSATILVFASSALFAAIGGRIGDWLRPRHEPEAELPTAQIR